MTSNQYAGLLALGALVGMSAFMIDRSIIVDNEIKAELVKLGALCDLIGIELSSGRVNLALEKLPRKTRRGVFCIKKSP